MEVKLMNAKLKKVSLLVTVAITALGITTLQAKNNLSQNNPFSGIPNVYVVNDDGTLASALNNCQWPEEATTSAQDTGCAILLEPGSAYQSHTNVGYFDEIMGLGTTPDAVTVNGGAAGLEPSRGSAGDNDTRTFWRALENLHVTGNEIWSVSQGAELRRDHFQSLALSRNGWWSSGGFIANSTIDGNVNYGSQQQWFARNANANEWSTGPFNRVFLGSTANHNAITAENAQTTVVDKTPKIAEKPYIVDENNQFSVVVPAEVTNKVGPTNNWSNPGDKKYSVVNNQVCTTAQCFIVVTPKDSATQINNFLASKNTKGIIFAPGSYLFNETINVTQDGQVLLGLGYPKLHISASNSPVIKTSAAGLRLAGLMFGNNQPTEAKLAPRTAPLLDVGAAADASTATSYLYDIFVREGVVDQSNTDVNNAAVVIAQGNVIGDNFWLWVRDGGGQLLGRAYHGLYVTGDNVSLYGLAVEHFFGNQTTWGGNNGQVYFYQSELPYTPPEPNQWHTLPSFAIDGSGVQNFNGYGIGAYAVIGGVWADAAIYAPNLVGIKLTNSFYWNNHGGSGNINHVIQYSDNPSWVDANQQHGNQYYRTYWQGSETRRHRIFSKK